MAFKRSGVRFSYAPLGVPTVSGRFFYSIMDINIFFSPVDKSLEDFRNDEGTLGSSMRIYFSGDEFPSIEGCNVAFFSLFPSETTEVTSVRRALYHLYNHWTHLNIVDLGNLREGATHDDTLFSLSQVIVKLLQNHVVPVVLGDNKNLLLSVYQSFSTIGSPLNLAIVDPRLNISDYLAPIIFSQPNCLFNFSNLGYQTYFVDSKEIDMMNDLYFDIHRLGTLHNSIHLSEPLIRSADIVGIDLEAFCAADMPGVKKPSPNGFSGSEGCQMARYAGFASRVSFFGLFGLCDDNDINNISAKLTAQMIWHFFDGLANRKEDYPKDIDSDFTRYIVHREDAADMLFLCNKTTGKWWMEITNKNIFIPCSKEDYLTTVNGEIPDRWWQYFQKIM